MTIRQCSKCLQNINTNCDRLNFVCSICDGSFPIPRREPKYGYGGHYPADTQVQEAQKANAVRWQNICDALDDPKRCSAQGAVPYGKCAHEPGAKLDASLGSPQFIRGLHMGIGSEELYDQEEHMRVNQMFYGDKDPNGKSQHEPGAKLDAGRVRMGLVMRDFAKALYAVAEVATYGANKYTLGGWVFVPDGINRYTDDMHRHLNAEAQGKLRDDESGLAHAAHAAWGALARLELLLAENGDGGDHE